MFGDTGIPLLFNQMIAVGSRLPDLQVYLVGGAALLSASALFAVGDRNVAMAKLLLDKNHIVPRGCQLGDHLSRTVRLEIATGHCVVIAAGRKEIQL